MKKLALALAIIAVSLMIFQPSVLAARQVTLAWDEAKDADLNSTLLFFRASGTAKYDYTKPVATVAKGTQTAQVTIASDGYFVARSRDNSGNQSVDSNEVDTVAPSAPGAVRVTVVVEVTP